MYLFLLISLLLLILVIFTYNSIVLKNVEVETAQANINALLKQRYDMIPNLVKTVKGYAKHEKETLEKVTKLRKEAMQCESITEKNEQENEITKAISKILAVAENYPELKANENYLKLQKNLKDIEDEIKTARTNYNNAVREYNTTIAIFPNNAIAKFFEFGKKSFFEIEEQEKKNVEVEN